VKLFENNQSTFDEKIDQLIQKYENQLVRLKEELDLKLKVELHELEERKNLHINELINNH
jgi:growth arrest-specific protein 8